MQYNLEHNITPKAVSGNKRNILSKNDNIPTQEQFIEKNTIAADSGRNYTTRAEIEKAIEKAKIEMKKCAKNLEFIEAAQYRDLIIRLNNELKEISKN